MAGAKVTLRGCISFADDKHTFKRGQIQLISNSFYIDKYSGMDIFHVEYVKESKKVQPKKSQISIGEMAGQKKVAKK